VTLLFILGCASQVADAVGRIHQGDFSPGIIPQYHRKLALQGLFLQSLILQP
jgi:hypothetical protein